jgi:SOS-response transcriptional repressor LexA
VNLTRQQADVLEAILAFKVAHSFAPTVRELAEALGFSSPATIQRHLDALEDKGYITRQATKPRTIAVKETVSAPPQDVLQPRDVRPLPANGEGT